MSRVRRLSALDEINGKSWPRQESNLQNTASKIGGAHSGRLQEFDGQLFTSRKKRLGVRDSLDGDGEEEHTIGIGFPIWR
jgi:hypothetical protein